MKNAKGILHTMPQASQGTIYNNIEKLKKIDMVIEV
jgi:hypothetical protein